MSTMKTVWIIGLMILMLALAACGGGGDDSAAPGGGAPDQTEEAAPVSMGDVDAGKEQFDMLCFACHGPGGNY